MVGVGRVELPTSRLSGVRSNRAELQALFKFFNDYTYTHRKRNDDGENPAIFTKLMAFYSKNLKILTNQYQ